MAAQAKKQIGSLFRKNLLDMVKGLRSHKTSESEYINQCLSDIKEEVKSTDKETKAAAISKLTYLYMLGYDISFAHFNVVEVMSQPLFSHRRIAYLAASLSFTVDTDVILLTVHLFKKRFKNSSGIQEGSMYESGCAINCLANICTPYLAETLLEDIYTMMNSTKPYLRKKSVLVLYSIFRKFPRALRLTFDRLRDKLKDDDGGVQNAAVNVICELARKNPSNYLSLLPHLFDLLNNSNNNWMLIKLVKLLGSLIPAEPRLGRKLQEPLTHIISNTPAKSLLYECINTVTTQHTMQRSMIRLCLDKLRGFVEDQDQNLKYLGLLGLNKIMDKNKRAVSQHKDLILQCLDDSDITIRMRALDLITSMVNEKNLEIIIQRLTDHLYGTDGSYRDHVLEQIINVSSGSDYEFVRDFAWYVQLLTNMTGLNSMCKMNALLIARQLMDVTIRVPEVREFSVSKMEQLLIENDMMQKNNEIQHILVASAYIVGEYSSFVQSHLTLVSAMLQSRISSLPQNIQCIFIHNALKVVLSNVDMDLVQNTIRLLEPLCTSSFIEVQERANAYLFFMTWMSEHEQLYESLCENKDMLFNMLFSSELMPLHRDSQKVIAEKIPTGLNLDEWMFDEPVSDDSLDSLSDFDGDLGLENIEDQNPDDWYSDEDQSSKKKNKKKNKKFVERQSIERKEKQKMDPWYIGADDEEEAVGRRRKKEKSRKLTKNEIENADIKQIDGEDINDMKVIVNPKGSKLEKVDKNKIPKNFRNKKYIVLNKNNKTNKSNNKGANDGKVVVVSRNNDDLSADIDLTKPMDPTEMEQYTLKPYSQTDIEKKQIVQLDTEKKAKKDKRKNKRKEKKLREKEKKKQKKARKKAKKLQKKEQEPEKKEPEPEEDDGFVDDDLLGFITQSSTKKKVETDDFLNGIFNESNGKKPENGTESEPAQKAKKSKKRSKKNGLIEDFVAEDMRELLFADQSIKITYFGHPSRKKASTYLDLIIITENISDNEIKSIKISLTKAGSSGFRPKEKDKLSYGIGKKLKCGSFCKTIIKFKCHQYTGSESDSIKCKISYNSFKSQSLYIQLATHCFIIADNNDLDETATQKLIKMIGDKDAEICPYSQTERLKLSKNISCGQALDTLVKIWRVANLSMTDKKAVYYGKLMLNKHLAINVKTNTKKNAIEITLSGSDQQFIDSMIQQFKSILFN